MRSTAQSCLTTLSPLPPLCLLSGLQRLESEVTHLRQVKVQLEGSVKAKDREAERLGKVVEGLKVELHEAGIR